MQIIPKMPPKWMAGKQPTVKSVQRVPSKACWRLWVCIELGRKGKGHCYYIDIYVNEFALLKRGQTGSIKHWRDFDVALNYDKVDNQMRISAAEDAQGAAWHYLRGHEPVRKLWMVAA